MNKLTQILLFFALSSVCFGAELKYHKGSVEVIRDQKTLKLREGATLLHNDKIRVGSKSLAIIVSSASTIKISENTTYILDLREPEILSGTLSKGALVVQFLKSKLIKRKDYKDSDPAKKLTIKTKVASIGVRGTKFFTYSGIKSGSILSVENGVVDFKGSKQKESVKLGEKTSSLTNEKEMVLKPRKFNFENKINWNVENREGKPLEHDEHLYSQLENIWKIYKDEEAQAWKNQKSEMEDKWNNMNDMSDMFNN